MEVKLVQMSDNAIGLMYLAARNCYSAGGPSRLVEQIGNKFSEDMWKLVGNVLKSGHHCYDDQTEVLTSEGFKRWVDVDETDLIASVMPGTYDIVYAHPESLVKQEYDGDMYLFDNKYVNLCVTPNHRLYTSIINRHQDRTQLHYAFHKCDDIVYMNNRKNPRVVAEKLQKFHTCANMNSSIVYNPLDLPPEKIISFNKLIGFFIGDGYAEGGNILDFHLRKKRKIEYLRSLAQELGFTFTERANGRYKVVYPNIGRYARQHYYEGKDKVIPTFLLSCSKECALAFIDGMKNSDGCHYSKASFTYVTTSRKCADTLQAMVHIHGGYASLKQKQAVANQSVQYQLEINLSSAHADVYVNDTRHISPDVTKSHYKGFVYCCTVPTGLLMVRRRNKICLSGNSIAEHAYFTFTIEGMSRACLAQISRHRHASLSVQSQRYVEIKEDYNTIQELYTDAIQNRTLSSICNLCNVLDKYFIGVDEHNFITLSMILLQYLSDTQSGVKAEDARMILPNCTKTNMVISMNLRELIHIAELRLCKRAQAEIREMVQEMCNLVVEKEPLFKELFGPPCKKYGKCKEAHPCTEK